MNKKYPKISISNAKNLRTNATTPEKILWKYLRKSSDNRNIKIQCPAKINLTLKVTGKREDGYHNIDSIMQTISLFDYLTISVEKNDKTEIILSGTSDEIPYNEKNLVHKACLLFLEETKLPAHRISVFIEKNIPVAAGLAGGSTDAAGMLYGLNKLFDEPLSREGLHGLCAKLGSDLNLCLEGGRQKTSGRGEILEPLEFEEFEVSLIKPENLGISAKEAYTKFSEKITNYSPLAGSNPPTLTLPLEGGGKKYSHQYSEFAKEKSKELRKNMTDAEKKLWQYIRKEQINGLKFRRQQPIGPYIADFICQPIKLIIELDGGQHNENENIKYDEKRTEYLQNAGYIVLRIWNNEIFQNIESVVEKIIETANSLTPRGGGLGWGARDAYPNDLEWAVIDDYKELQEIKKLYPKSVMSGSGSTYFGIDTEFKPQKGFWIKNNLKSIPYGVKEV